MDRQQQPYVRQSEDVLQPQTLLPLYLVAVALLLAEQFADVGRLGAIDPETWP